MPYFTSNPITIEAHEFTYPPKQELKDFCPCLTNFRKDRHPGAKAEADIKTLEDGSDGQCAHVATEGDYIIKGTAGEFYACKPDIFKHKYFLQDDKI